VVRDIDAAEDWLDSWTASVSAEAERAAQLSRRVAALTGHAESVDGSIKVTVGSSGQVDSLDLDDRVQRLPGAELAQRIMSVIRRAQASLSTQVAREVQATVGADTETGRAVIHSFESRFPAQEDNESDDEVRRGS
jgi:YbaB/EbfC DNA-binding family